MFNDSVLQAYVNGLGERNNQQKERDLTMLGQQSFTLGILPTQISALSPPLEPKLLPFQAEKHVFYNMWLKKLEFYIYLNCDLQMFAILCLSYVLCTSICAFSRGINQ